MSPSSLALISAVLTVCVASCTILARRLRYKAFVEQTCLVDLPHVADDRTEYHKLDGTVVICGGSIAGLLTARVCHNHFKRIIIVEPEAWLATDEARKVKAWTQEKDRSRIIQYRSLQGSQCFTLMAYRTFFPNFDDEAEASEIPITNYDFRTYIWGYFPTAPYHQYPNGLPPVCFPSRRGLETLLRRLVLDKDKFPNIEYVVGSVSEFHADPACPSRLQKVTVRTDDGNIDLNAELVVDCTGASHAGVRMLRHAGYGFADNYPKGTLPFDKLGVSYDQKMHYVTMELTVPPELGNRLPIPGGYEGRPAIFISVTQGSKDHKTIYWLRVDGNRVHVCCGGWGKPEVPRTLKGAQEWARSMVLDNPIPDWFFESMDMLEEVESTMHVSFIRVPPSVYYRFHQAVNLPSNWVALGDSVMRLNPVFGQGITKAIFGIIALNRVLRTIPTVHPSDSKQSSHILPSNFSKQFFDGQERSIGSIWSGTKTVDYGYKTTVPIDGETLSQGSWLRWYIGKLQIISLKDRDVNSVLWHNRMFLAPGIDIMHPKLVLKVLWSCVVG
ncbi:hypothetical protein SERLA73DRAFT_186050 [Serpula lacrymans var. lacrymans S7.3]|uniref:Monooxygenase n=2 Tax=Serpula lacrymans var. lacrymans TaxID=341189 RepID=F8Q6V3_SERL3|nr:putative monooxygenase [Serpula lacrymans var. lacrymans S7.9]EGN96341.1 hypothetical protein SERLA73DRAFT_186050 [Serpula lacrymans var. lacrymans S7.3]EGO21880.1 putative monooxygenase [Serpula lacrymans var. lacrymans S7.9]